MRNILRFRHMSYHKSRMLEEEEDSHSSIPSTPTAVDDSTKRKKSSTETNSFFYTMFADNLVRCGVVSKFRKVVSKFRKVYNETTNRKSCELTGADGASWSWFDIGNVFAFKWHTHRSIRF